MYIRNCKLHIWMCPLFRCLFLFCSSVSNFQIQSWFENRPLASFGMVNVQQGSVIWMCPYFKGQKEVSLQMVRISSRLWNPSAIENQPKRLASCICHLKSALFTSDFKWLGLFQTPSLVYFKMNGRFPDPTVLVGLNPDKNPVWETF